MDKIMNLKNGLGLLTLIIYIINIAAIIYFNPFNITNNYTKTVIFFSLFTGILNIFIWNYFANNPISSLNNNFQLGLKVLKVISILFLFYTLIYSIYYYTIFTPWPLTILITILNIFFIIGLISLLYKLFLPNVNVLNNKSKFSLVLQLIKHIILYIPCLFIDLIEFVKKQYKITTKTVWIIFLIELIIIMLRIILPMIYKIYHNTSGILIKKGPINLNNEDNLGTFQNKNLDLSTKIDNINYNYAISMWLWINPQPKSTSPAYNKSTNLLNYGNILNIEFYKNKLIFWAASNNNKVQIFELKNIPYQKWNNIVLNHNSGTLDIFINNKLVSSNINITPIIYSTEIISGANNGINGGIKNLIYYDRILSKNDIYSIYTSE